VAKVTINGEVFRWDPARKPLSEALAIEDGLKCKYADYETGLQGGSARSLAGFIWLVWRRNGRDVPLADILSGDVEVDLDGLSIEDDGDEAGPTSPSPGRSATTGTGTSASSRKSSA
jgi:hypothetical protein